MVSLGESMKINNANDTLHNMPEKNRAEHSLITQILNSAIYYTSYTTTISIIDHK